MSDTVSDMEKPDHVGASGIAAMALVVVLVLFAVFLTGYPGNDDKYITYAAADAMAQGQGFANVNGEPTEQSSTLLLTALLAGVHVLAGVSAPFAGYWVALAIFAAMAVGLAAILRTAGKPAWLFAVPLLSPAVLHWSLSGMETGLYIALLLGWLVALDLSRRRKPLSMGLLSAAFAALLTLTRPEAPFVMAAALGLWVLFLRDRSWAIAAIGSLIGGVLAAFALRLSIGLTLFPLPVSAKVGGGTRLEDVLSGLDYLYRTWRLIPMSTTFAMLCLGAVLVVSSARRNDRSAALALGACSVSLAVIAFTVAAGGDWMPFGRFIAAAIFLSTFAAILVLPLSPVLILVAAVSATTLDLQKTMKWVGTPSFAFSPLIGPDEGVAAAPLDRTSVLHARDMILTKALLDVIEADPRTSLTIASVQAGFVPYWIARETTKSVHFVDLKGLTTRDLHGCALIPSPFDYPVYEDIRRIETCAGRKIDYFYDLNFRQRDQRIEAQGCQVVYRLDRSFKLRTWTAPWTPDAFIAAC